MAKRVKRATRSVQSGDICPLIETKKPKIEQKTEEVREAMNLETDISKISGVLQAISQIPPGETRSFLEVASLAGKPGSARAVGREVATVPTTSPVPWHRVVGSDGSLAKDSRRASEQMERLRSEGARPAGGESPSDWSARVGAALIGLYGGGGKRVYVEAGDLRASDWQATRLEPLKSLESAHARGFRHLDIPPLPAPPWPTPLPPDVPLEPEPTTAFASRLEAVDWPQIFQSLELSGVAHLPGLLTKREVAEIRAGAVVAAKKEGPLQVLSGDGGKEVGRGVSQRESGGLDGKQEGGGNGAHVRGSESTTAMREGVEWKPTDSPGEEERVKESAVGAEGHETGTGLEKTENLDQKTETMVREPVEGISQSRTGVEGIASLDTTLIGDRNWRFDRTVEMARYGGGYGRYHYFAEPLPPPTQVLRARLYEILRPVAESIRSGRRASWSGGTAEQGVKSQEKEGDQGGVKDEGTVERKSDRGGGDGKGFLEWKGSSEQDERKEVEETAGGRSSSVPSAEPNGMLDSKEVTGDGARSVGQACEGRVDTDVADKEPKKEREDEEMAMRQKERGQRESEKIVHLENLDDTRIAMCQNPDQRSLPGPKQEMAAPAVEGTGSGREDGGQLAEYEEKPGMKRRRGEQGRYPPTLDAFWDECRSHGQSRPSTILLCYGEGGHNHPHRDLYGASWHPLQGLVVLSQRGREFEGGDFFIEEEVGREESQEHICHDIPADAGDLVIFCSNYIWRTGRGGERTQVGLRHGMRRVTRGTRFALGIAFHLAQ